MSTNPKILAKEIISNFKKLYLSEDGLISTVFPPRKERTIFPHFDDIAPFFIFFYEEDFLLTQILKLKNLYNSFDRILANNNLIFSFRIDEFLGGIFALWEKTRNNELKQYLDYILGKIRKYFISNNNIYGTFDIQTRKSSKFYYPWSSGLLETFLEMTEYYPELQKIVINISDKWLSNRFFSKFYLFPFRDSDKLLYNFTNDFSSRLKRYKGVPPLYYKTKYLSSLRYLIKKINFNYLTSGLYARLMKSNTTFVFTLIELYRRTQRNVYKNAVIKWIDSVSTKLFDNGIVYGYFYPNGIKKDTALANSFIFIDVLMDAYYFLQKNEDYLKMAKKIINCRIQNSWKNGLIPSEYNGNKTFIDALVDFSISIRRYAELSGDHTFLQISYKLMESTILNHRNENGYSTYVTKNGFPIPNTVSPKYNGLLLKGLINMLTINDLIYDESNSYRLHEIFKDR